MAEGISNKLLPEDITIKSAGTEAHDVNPNAIKVMSDLSIPISHHKSERIDFKDLDNFDIIITLCGDAKDNCPIISDNKHIHWEIEDPEKYKEDKEGSIKKYSKRKL